jgi:hypothetical protein
MIITAKLLRLFLERMFSRKIMDEIENNIEQQMTPTILEEEKPVEKLSNLTVEDIVKKSYDEEVITSDVAPFNNVRNNSKIFLIYYAKSQLSRVIKLTNYLQVMEDRMMDALTNMNKVHPALYLQAIEALQKSVDSAIQLIDKVSTNDNYISLIYNDNRQQLIDNSQNLISNRIEISKDSREKLRRIAEHLLSTLDKSTGDSF